MAFPASGDIEPLRAKAHGASALLFCPPPFISFASGKISIEKSYRVCSTHLRALIVRRIHESIAFFKGTRRIAVSVANAGRDANALSRTQPNRLAHRFRARPQAVRCAFPERNAAMTKVRVGLVGCGFVAELHMYAYRRGYWRHAPDDARVAGCAPHLAVSRQQYE